MPRVLVIDDYPGVLQVMAWCLTRCGYEVLTASSALAGLKVAREHGAELVLVGFDMPHMDGIAFCEAVKRDPQLARLPVALMTGIPTPEIARRAVAAGALAVLGKPFDWSQLLDLLSRQLPQSGPTADPVARGFSETLRHSRLRSDPKPANTSGQSM